MRGHVEKKGTTAEIAYINPVSNGTLTMRVRPQFNEAYAIYRTPHEAIFIMEDDSSDFTTQTRKVFNKEYISISDKEPEPDNGCVAGSACRIFADGGQSLNTELYCCYDNDSECNGCYWGESTYPCASDCDINGACYNDCYCGGNC